MGGTEEERLRDVMGAPRFMLPLVFASISPLVDAILLVKEEIAQPAHDVSFWGVPMRGTTPFDVGTLGGGIAVSGSVEPYLRTRPR